MKPSTRETALRGYFLGLLYGFPNLDLVRSKTEFDIVNGAIVQFMCVGSGWRYISSLLSADESQ